MYVQLLGAAGGGLRPGSVRESPDPDADQEHPDQALAPARQELQPREVDQGVGDAADRQHAGRVSESPAQADAPGSAARVDREGGDRGHVIRPQQDVPGSEGEAGEERTEPGGAGYRAPDWKRSFGPDAEAQCYLDILVQ